MAAASAPATPSLSRLAITRSFRETVADLGVRQKMKNSIEPRKRQISTLIILPMMGVASLISSIPFFFIKQPFAIYYPRYYNGKGVSLPAITEVIDNGTGTFFGIWLAAIGIFLIYLYIRIKSNSPEDGPHGHKGRH